MITGTGTPFPDQQALFRDIDNPKPQLTFGRSIKHLMAATRNLSLSLVLIAFLLSSCKNEPADTQTEAIETDTTATTDIGPTEGFYADYEGTNRVIWQKPEIVISRLGDLENKTVADIGAGTGHFSKRLALKAKKVIAIDIDERFIRHLDSIRFRDLPEGMSDRLEPRLADPNDPHLKAGEADAVLIVNTFMYMDNRVAYLSNLLPAMNPGARILIIDFKKIATPIGPSIDIRLSSESVVAELRQAGFRNIQADTSTLQYQYIVLAEK